MNVKAKVFGEPLHTKSIDDPPSSLLQLLGLQLSTSRSPNRRWALVLVVNIVWRGRICKQLGGLYHGLLSSQWNVDHHI